MTTRLLLFLKLSFGGLYYVSFSFPFYLGRLLVTWILTGSVNDSGAAYPWRTLAHQDRSCYQDVILAEVPFFSETWLQCHRQTAN